MHGQLALAAESGRARRGIVQLAAVLGVIRQLRILEQRREWKRSRLVDPVDEGNFLHSAVFAVAWGSDSLAPRAIGESGELGFTELSMTMGLLAWLAWDVGTDIEAAAQRNGYEAWRAVQSLAALAPWLADDVDAWAELARGISWTSRPQVDGQRWLAYHRAALETIALAEIMPDEFGTARSSTRPGDLVILNERESPRVRVVLDATVGGVAPKLTVCDPNAREGIRCFLATHVRTLDWALKDESIAVEQ